MSINVDNNVEAPDTYKFEKLVLFDKDVDVAFKLFTDNVELDDNEFIFLNTSILVDLAFKFFTDNIEFADNDFKLLI